MHFTKKSFFQKREELKNKLKKQKILKFPGAYNPLTAATAFFPSDENFIIATSFVAITAPFICFPSICLWVLFGSSIKLIITAVIILIN